MTQRLLGILSLFILFISLVLIYVNLVNHNSLIIYVDGYRGTIFWGDRSDVLKIAVVGLLLVLLNIFLASIFGKQNIFIAQILSYGGVLLSLLILMVISGIIFIN